MISDADKPTSTQTHWLGWPLGHGALRTLHTLSGLEWLVVGAAAPLLTLPTVRPSWTAAALALLVLLWLLRWAVRGEPWPVTPFNTALLLFVAMVPVAIWASAFPQVTVPAGVRLVFGLAAYRACAFAVEDDRTLDLALGAFCMLGLSIALIGATGVRWPAKATIFGGVTQHIPRLIETFPEDQGTPGVNPNHLAGGIVLYLPLAVGLVARAWRRRRWRLLPILAVAAAAGFLLVVGGVLLLTQSRSGWMGAVGGLFAMAVLAAVSARRRWTRILGAALLILAVVGCVGVVLALGPSEIGRMVTDPTTQFELEDVVGSVTLAGRIEIWSRALYAMQDFSFTGCGLGAFSRVVPILYPLFRISPDRDVGHAHNIFLQMAVDLGLPGLIAYLALVAVALRLCWRHARWGSETVRPVALGLAGGLISWHLYGLTDAVALGTKPAVVFWVALGLVAAMGCSADPP